MGRADTHPQLIVFSKEKIPNCRIELQLNKTTVF